VNTKQQNNDETDNFSSTWSVKDDLCVQSASPPATKTHSSYHVKLQKEVKSTQKQPSCKKKCSPCKKKRHHDKVVKSKVVAQKWL